MHPGAVLLYLEYSGLLIFQNRLSGLNVTLWPGQSGLPACTGSWMTDGTPGDADPVPDPCGALGGLSGTVYAPHQSTGSSDWDATVDIKASGLANLQIISARISMVYDTDARLAYRPDAFANGSMRLVE